MASKENKVVKEEVLRLKQDSAARALRMLSLAIQSRSVTRNSDVPNVSRQLRTL
jgi:hypothetical protein